MFKSFFQIRHKELLSKKTISTFFSQADARRRKLVQLRSFDRFDVCILKN